jgi:hypothetical protein
MVVLRNTERRMAVTCTVEKIHSRGAAPFALPLGAIAHTREPIAFFSDGLIIPYDQRAINVRGHPAGAARRSKRLLHAAQGRRVRARVV